MQPTGSSVFSYAFRDSISIIFYIATSHRRTVAPVTGLAALFGSVWGAGGVLYILAKAIKRVMPIALEPFKDGSVPLSQFELG